MKKKRNLVSYAKSTTFQLIIGFVFLLFSIGILLIRFFYGQDAAFLGLTCLIIGLIPTGLIIIILALIGKVIEKANKDNE